MHGEYMSMTRLHDTMPQLTPEPLAWGTYESNNKIHFFLCSFHDMDDKLCSLKTFPKLVAELHTRGISPNGKFGFPIATYQGRLPQNPTETDSWEECFANNVKIMFDYELTAQGPDDEIAQLREKIMDKVIPRLLRPMEVGGKKVVPRLVHGDLWEGNAGTDLETGLPKIFDACSLYAHNECELNSSCSAFLVHSITDIYHKTRWRHGDQ